MKRKGSVAECAGERGRDLMAAYDRCVAECRHISLPAVYARVAASPAPRFYVSPSRAALVVSLVARGKDALARMHCGKREMFGEISRRVALLRRGGDSRPLLALCADVVAQPAPSFYLTAGSVKMIVCKLRKEWNRQKRERLLRLRSRSL
jgi:hypothetical protein